MADFGIGDRVRVKREIGIVIESYANVDFTADEPVNLGPGYVVAFPSNEDGRERIEDGYGADDLELVERASYTPAPSKEIAHG